MGNQDKDSLFFGRKCNAKSFGSQKRKRLPLRNTTQWDQVYSEVCRVLAPDQATRNSNTGRILTLKTQTRLNSSSIKPENSYYLSENPNTLAKVNHVTSSNLTIWNSMKLELNKKWARSGTSRYFTNAINEIMMQSASCRFQILDKYYSHT